MCRLPCRWVCWLSVARLATSSPHRALLADPDVGDVSVALCAAERRGVVVSTDPGDIDAVGLELALIAV